MNLKECDDLVWEEILREDKENFTPEFRRQVLNVIQKIIVEGEL